MHNDAISPVVPIGPPNPTSVDNLSFPPSENRDAPPVSSPSSSTPALPSASDTWTKKDWLYLVLIGLILAGTVARMNFSLTPMNDEVLYVAAAMEHHFDYAPKKELNAEHPPVAKWLFSRACWVINCEQPILYALYREAYPISVPVPGVVEALWPIMAGMRVVSFLFSLALAAVLYWFAKRVYGPLVGACIATLSMLSTNLAVYSNVVMLDMIMVFFYITSLLYYLYVYRHSRHWTRALVLLFLLVAAFGSKQYIPLTLLPILAVMEFLDYRKTRKFDRTLLATLGGAIFLFFSVVYPLPVFLHHFFDFYSKGTNVFTLGLNFDVWWVVFSRLELVLLIPLAFSAWLFSREGFTLEEKGLVFAVMVLLGLLLKIPAEKSAFRYALAVFPLIILLCGKSFSKLLTIRRGFVVVASLLFIGVIPLVAGYPYYDSATGPLSVFYKSAGIERSETFPLLAYLHKNYPGRNLFTTDYYELPYAKDVSAININGYLYVHELNVQNNTSYLVVTNLPSGKTYHVPTYIHDAFHNTFCTYPEAVFQFFKEDRISAIVYRKHAAESFIHCQTIEDFVTQSASVYEDESFKVVDFSKD